MREPGFISAVLLSAAAVVDGLEVSSGSGCHAVCRAGDTSTTTVDDIVCEDTQFSSTSQGLQFSRCLTCLQDSSHKSGSDADVYDYLCKSTSPVPTTSNTSV